MMSTTKVGQHYTDLLRQVNELKRQLHLVEAERKACEDEGNEIVKRNQQRLNDLKQQVNDIKTDLSDATRIGGGPLVTTQQAAQLGILQVLREHDIDASKYKLSKTADEILADLNDRIADIIKQSDLAKHQTRMTYKRIGEIDEELNALPPSPMAVASSSASTNSAVTGKHGHLTKMNGAEATLTEIQSVRQKMGEAYHIQRQYRTILDVLATERIGHDAQLLGLEKSIEEAKAETAKLKEVREAARRAKDAAKTELQHYEETLVASTRETDRLLSDYKRRIDEMKSSATPSQHQRQRSMGNIHHLMPLPTPHGAFNRMSLTSDAISTVGLNNDGSSSGDPLAGSSGPTGGASISGLHDAKRAIDHLKSVTGATDIRSTIHIVESQKEKCDELRQQFSVLQERQGYLSILRDSLHGRLHRLIESSILSGRPGSTDGSNGRPTPRLLDQLFQDNSEQDGQQIQVEDRPETEDEQLPNIDYASALIPLVALIIKMCTQIPFGPSVEETLEPTKDGSASMVQHENALNLLETKLSSLVEMARSLASNNRAAEPLLSSNNQQTDSFFSQQVGQMSLPSSPRMTDSAQTEGPMLSERAGTLPAAAVAQSTTRSAGPTVGAPPSAPKLRSGESLSDEDQVPTRGFLKRQTRIIVEAKTKKQNQRPRKGGD